MSDEVGLSGSSGPRQFPGCGMPSVPGLGEGAPVAATRAAVFGQLIETLEAVGTEISDHGGFAATTEAGIREVWPRFERFCATRGLEPLPCTEDAVLGFLEVHARGLRHGSAKRLVTCIQQAHALAGHPCPPWPRVKKYLGCLRREGPAAEPKVSSLTEAQAERMATGLAAPVPNPATSVLRGILCLARLGALSTWAAVERTEFTIGPDGALRSGESLFQMAVASVVHELLTDATQVPRSTCSTEAAAVRYRVLGAAARAGIPLASLGDVPGLSEPEFHLLLGHCDPDLDRQTRDLAWLTLGLADGLRHISLAHLDIRDLVVIDGGFEAVVRVAKLSPGQTLVVPVMHLSQAGDGCLDVLCPACALEQQLAVCRRQGRTSGPVLATRYANQWRAMTRQNGRLRILKMFMEDASADERSRRIATRSLRRTAATWACAAGMTMSEVAAQVTHHKSVEVLAGYVELGPEHEVHPCYPKD